MKRELLVREYRRETGEDWVEPKIEIEAEAEAQPASTSASATEDASARANGTMWEFRWIDGRDNAAKQGPFDGPAMKAWQDAGYFGQGVEFRVVGSGEDAWAASADFSRGQL